MDIKLQDFQNKEFIKHPNDYSVLAYNVSNNKKYSSLNYLEEEPVRYREELTPLINDDLVVGENTQLMRVSIKTLKKALRIMKTSEADYAEIAMSGNEMIFDLRKYGRKQGYVLVKDTRTSRPDLNSLIRGFIGANEKWVLPDEQTQNEEEEGEEEEEEIIDIEINLDFPVLSTIRHLQPDTWDEDSINTLPTKEQVIETLQSQLDISRSQATEEFERVAETNVVDKTRIDEQTHVSVTPS